MIMQETESFIFMVSEDKLLDGIIDLSFTAACYLFWI